jgi:hypothetical protein
MIEMNNCQRTPDMLMSRVGQRNWLVLALLGGKDPLAAGVEAA